VANENTDELIEHIVSLSRLTHTGLDKKIDRFMKHYAKEKKRYTLILKQSDKQYRRVRQQEDELRQLKENLEQRVEEEIQKRAEKETMLEQQAKMAAMGEMMDAVAHQWKQPLNAISMLSDLLQSDYNDGNVDQDYIDDVSNTIEQQVEHMVSTLNEFRTFFRPNKTAEPFGLRRSLQGVQLLVKDEFLQNGITIDIDNQDEVIINGIENEFKHLILNIINNAKDAFNERRCKERNISIRFFKEDATVYIEIEDNAGGIPEQVINDIFKPNITTKPEDKGTGIGLYMSARIVEKHQGKIMVNNNVKGALFTISLPLSQVACPVPHQENSRI